MIKMDTEGMEYAILDKLEATGAHNLIGEFFVEFHFQTDKEIFIKTKDGGWNERATRSFGPDRPVTKEMAESYFRRWRGLVPAFHAWA